MPQKLILNVSLFLFLTLSVGSCIPSKFLFDGKKVKEVQVTDIAELYSTYKLTKEDRRELSSQLSNQSLIDQIATYSQEENWPDAINTLNDRLKVRATMQKYHFYKVGTFGNKTVVAVPASKNRHMPDGFVPAGALYMIFKNNVVIPKPLK
ncbi:MAG TPA: hypothetical protein VFV46_01155 [Lacibacter sp.]|nr:hypothetical protein [Lacibacter sp.]